ncbi:hypothetical protein KIN20_019906 [Parelaphostrongylus tenuis]|uniref:Uncharacterized protein n=1 Tax=Parelaphostrongylus tenuis TaxID=148309 RepID=A0AAD5QST0_PARTN|nr:hypothetical protein KIN20_019906 [Parelaphostrongylus tenuis]
MGEFPGADSSGSSAEPSFLQEGKARLALHKPVFYNPVQEFNRDLTVYVLREFVRTRMSKQNGDVDSEEPKAKKSNYWLRKRMTRSEFWMHCLPVDYAHCASHKR